MQDIRDILKGTKYDISDLRKVIYDGNLFYCTVMKNGGETILNKVAKASEGCMTMSVWTDRIYSNQIMRIVLSEGASFSVEEFNDNEISHLWLSVENFVRDKIESAQADDAFSKEFKDALED